MLVLWYYIFLGLKPSLERMYWSSNFTEDQQLSDPSWQLSRVLAGVTTLCGTQSQANLHDERL